MTNKYRSIESLIRQVVGESYSSYSRQIRNRSTKSPDKMEDGIEDGAKRNASAAAAAEEKKEDKKETREIEIEKRELAARRRSREHSVREEISVGTKKRIEIKTVSRLVDPAPTSEKSKLSRTAEITSKIIEGNSLMYSDNKFGLTASLINATKSILERAEDKEKKAVERDDEEEVNLFKKDPKKDGKFGEVAGGKTYIELEPETDEDNHDGDDDKITKKSGKNEKDEFKRRGMKEEVELHEALLPIHTIESPKGEHFSKIFRNTTTGTYEIHHYENNQKVGSSVTNNIDNAHKIAKDSVTRAQNSKTIKKIRESVENVDEGFVRPYEHYGTHTGTHSGAIEHVINHMKNLGWKHSGTTNHSDKMSTAYFGHKSGAKAFATISNVGREPHEHGYDIHSSAYGPKKAVREEVHISDEELNHINAIANTLDKAKNKKLDEEKIEHFRNGSRHVIAEPSPADPDHMLLTYREKNQDIAYGKAHRSHYKKIANEFIKTGELRG